VPFGWNDAGTSGTKEPYKTFAESTSQEMIIFNNGRTGVRKLGNQVVRMTNDVIILNAEVVK
jgi:dihydrodipicolinate synthase/N-acetylneuraminate lyase